MKHVAVLVLGMALGACVPISSKEMQPIPQIYQQLTVDKGLEKSIKLGDVRVGGAEGVLDAYTDNPVKQADYREGLQTALRSANMLAQAGDNEKYVLDANLMALDVPFKLFSFSVTVNSGATYRLRRLEDNYIIWDETLKLPFTAKFSDAFDAATRVRMAKSNAIRENITHMIRVLSSKSEAELTKQGT